MGYGPRIFPHFPLKPGQFQQIAKYIEDSEVIDTPTWRNIQRLTDLRNFYDHQKKVEPNKEEVSELIRDVEKIIKTVS